MYSSSLPAIIDTDRTNFEKPLINAKFSDGPTALNPGPILPRHVITEVKHVVISTFSNEIRNVPINTRNI